MNRVLVCCLLLSAPATAGCLIRGTVLDGISGKPLPGTRVFAKRAESHQPGILHVADASGAFCFERLDRGDYEIVPTAPGTGLPSMARGPAAIPALSSRSDRKPKFRRSFLRCSPRHR